MSLVIWIWHYIKIFAAVAEYICCCAELGPSVHGGFGRTAAVSSPPTFMESWSKLYTAASFRPRSST